MLYQLALYVLAPFAIFGLLLHIGWGLFTTVFLFRFMSRAMRNRLIHFWSRVLLLIVGVRLVVHGEGPDKRLAATGMTPQTSGLMLLANHASWLDIYAIHATVPTRFVAKSELARWPVLGTLIAGTGTLFVERGRRHAVHAMNLGIAQCLRAGETIGVFPEGTTGDGSTLLPFHANLMQPALDTGAQLRPVALRYTQDGNSSRAAVYIGDDHLLVSLWRVVTAPRLLAEVFWLPPLPAGLARRHEAARLAQDAIAAALGVAVDVSARPYRPAPATSADPASAGSAPESAADPAN
jgi:1-acyl-sn-glycerol-3-phosphate acyltransferase